MTKPWLVYRLLTGSRTQNHRRHWPRWWHNLTDIELSDADRHAGMSSHGSFRRRQAERVLGFADPAPHGRIAGEIEAAFVRDARIGEQRYVGERDRLARQEARCGEMLLHPRQRGMAALHLLGIEPGSRLLEIDHLEAADGDIGLVAVLLPEQPLIHPGSGV